MAIDQGPATGNGVLTESVPGTAGGAGGYAITTGIEVHVGNPPSQGGINALEPSRAPFTDPGANYFNVNSVTLTPTNKTVTDGVTGATIKHVNPA